MSDYLPFIVAGLATGSLYSIAGLGLVLSFRTSGVFNFGHGAIAAGAAFLFDSLHVEHGQPWPVAAAVTLVTFGLLGGFALELLTRTLADVPAAIMVLVTVGIFLAVNGFLLVEFGALPRQAPSILPTTGFTVAEVNVSWAQVVAALLAIGAAFGLNAFLTRTRLGMSMRAVVDNPTLLSLTGEQPARVRRFAWIIGAAFAALSGVLLAPTLGLDATLLTLLVVQAFGACAIGFFSDLRLTYLGGLVVGVLAALATKLFTTFPLNQSPPAVPFMVLIAILLVVPLTRLPRGRVGVRSLASGPSPLSARQSTAVAALGVLFLLSVPQLVGTHLPSWTEALSSVVLFGSLSLLIWNSGQISLCQISFAALGATTMAHLSDAGVPWLLALVLAGLLTVPVGMLIAIPAIRFSGIYLALITFGFGLLMAYVVYPSVLMFGTDLTVRAKRLHLGLLDVMSSDSAQYYASLVVAAAAVGGLVVLNRTRFGRLLRGLSESPTMLSTLGLDVNVTRLLLFSISAFYAGVAGALMATQYAVSSVSFFPVISLVIVAVLGITGLFGGRLILTTLVAAFLYSVVPGYITDFDQDLQALIFGCLAIAAGLVIANRPRLHAWLEHRAGAGDSRRRFSPVTDRGRWQRKLLWGGGGRSRTGGDDPRWSSPADTLILPITERQP